MSMNRTSAIILPDDIQIEYDREVVRRQGLAGFAKIAWHVMEPRTHLKWGWALDAICEHLQAVSSGEIIRLLMNVPPGTMKSYLTSVLWPSFEWGPLNMPSMQYLTTAYKETLSTRDSRRMRDLVQSRWYQDRWPLYLKRVGETSFENDQGGKRESMAFNSLTGERGDRVIVDDPHSTDKAESPIERFRTIRTWKESVPLRLNDPILSAIIVIMQRLNQLDVSGEILANELDDYVHLMLPMEFELGRRCHTSIGFVDPRTKEDELLFPERFPLHVVKRDSKKLGIFASAGQMQQRPVPREGNIVKFEWFEKRFRERGKNPIRVIQSWDCASKPGERNDPSACLTLAEFKDHIELWHYVAKRQAYPDLVRHCKDRYAAEPLCSAVLIEDKDAGQQLIQQLKADKDSKLPVIACNPGVLDKVTRLDTETPMMEAGEVWLPENEPWVYDYVEEITTIPSAPHDESGDTTSQALKWLREKRKRIPGAGIVSVGGKESSRL